jgi:hypothetical protein
VAKTYPNHPSRNVWKNNRKPVRKTNKTKDQPDANTRNAIRKHQQRRCKPTLTATKHKTKTSAIKAIQGRALEKKIGHRRGYST